MCLRYFMVYVFWIHKSSVFGPPFVVLNINDLPDLIQYAFADDGVVIIHSDYKSLQAEINKTVEIVIKWLNLNNVSK